MSLEYFCFKKHYTQEYLAELTNLSATYISRLETLETSKHCPSFEKLECLAKSFEIENFEFYGTKSKFMIR